MEILQTVIEGGAAVVGGVFLGALLSLPFLCLIMAAEGIFSMFVLILRWVAGKNQEPTLKL